MKKLRLILNAEEELQLTKMSELLAGVSLEDTDLTSEPHAGCGDHCRYTCSWWCEITCSECCNDRMQRYCSYKSVSPLPYTA